MALTGGFPRLAPAGAGDKGAQARTKRTPVCSLLSSRLRRCYGLTGEFADLHPNERPASRLSAKPRIAVPSLHRPSVLVASNFQTSSETGVHIALFQNPHPLAVWFHIRFAPGAHGGGAGGGSAHGGGRPQGPEPAGADGPPERCQSWQ